MFRDPQSGHLFGSKRFHTPEVTVCVNLQPHLLHFIFLSSWWYIMYKYDYIRENIVETIPQIHIITMSTQCISTIRAIRNTTIEIAKHITEIVFPNIANPIITKIGISVVPNIVFQLLFDITWFLWIVTPSGIYLKRSRKTLTANSINVFASSGSTSLMAPWTFFFPTMTRFC